MRHVARAFVLSVLALALFTPLASAETDVWAGLTLKPTAPDPWRVSWLTPSTVPPAVPALSLAAATAASAQEPQALHAGAVEHSEAYEMRRKIHKYASFATLPLFAAELALGQSLYNTPANADSKRGAHAAVGAGIVGLFAVNTVTGAWNMFGEDRHDPNGRAMRMLHGLLMMAADVGMVATAQSGPNSHSSRQALTFETSKTTHRNLAVASISVGTAGYLLMLFANH